jgi:hypothetical protein
VDIPEAPTGKHSCCVEHHLSECARRFDGDTHYSQAYGEAPEHTMKLGRDMWKERINAWSRVIAALKDKLQRTPEERSVARFRKEAKAAGYSVAEIDAYLAKRTRRDAAMAEDAAVKAARRGGAEAAAADVSQP